MFGYVKEDFSKIEDPLERKKAVYEHYFRKKTFNPLSFAWFVFLQYFMSFLFMSVIFFLIKSFRFQASKLVTYLIVIIGLVPVVFSTWIELIKIEKNHLTKWILNTAFTVSIFILSSYIRHLPLRFINFGVILILFANLIVGLLKMNYEDVNVREKLILFAIPFFIHFLTGILATIIMIILTIIKTLN